MRMSEENQNESIAYGDESVLLAAEPPLYLIAASILKSDEKSAIQTLVQAKPKGAIKLHWRSMTDAQKANSIAAISAIEHQTTIVAASPLVGIKQERARRKCLESLLIKLESLGVDVLTLESRRELLDGRDKDCLFYARRAKAVQSIDIAHIAGEEDPRLWLPDQILGAYGESERKLKAAEKWANDWSQVMESIEVLKVKI